MRRSRRSGRRSRRAFLRPPGAPLAGVALLGLTTSACGSGGEAVTGPGGPAPASLSTSPAPAPSPVRPPSSAAATRTPTSSTSPDPSPTSTASAQGPAGSASAALVALAIKGRAPKTGYDRGLFGPAWADVDQNGCDTRNDILARDLTEESFRPGTHDCVVFTGNLDDPYTGRSIIFSTAEAGAVQIDHVVALSDAWQKGAQQWEPDTRLAFANDPLNLLAVDGPTNASKSDGDAATWLPPDTSYRCPLVARQVAVKLDYQLAVTQAEHDAITRVLASCPDQQLPTETLTPTPDRSAPEPTPAPPLQADGADPDYGSCREAKANGGGPYVRGSDPEYAFYRDGALCSRSAVAHSATSNGTPTNVTHLVGYS